jgi:L-fucose mutarotase
MLKNIAPCISPELLKTLAEMGHGDEIIFADAHFPGNSCGCPRVLRADGLNVTTLLDGILPLFALDAYAPPLAMMAAVPGDSLDPRVETDYLAVVRKHEPELPPVERVERYAFYDRAQKAFAIVMTSETRQYGNIILKKGITPITGTGSAAI